MTDQESDDAYVIWVKTYHQWYATAVKSWGRALLACRSLAFISTTSTAIVAAATDATNVASLKWIILAIGVVGTISTTLMSEFGIAGMLALRERGRVEAADIAAYARDKFKEFQHDRNRINALQDEIRTKLTSLEARQGQEFAKAVAGQKEKAPEHVAG